MDYQYGNHSGHFRALKNGTPPFVNPPMFPHGGTTFYRPVMRGMPRKGGPPGRMMRSGFRPERPPISYHQQGFRPPCNMINRPIFFSKSRNGCAEENVYYRQHHFENSPNNYEQSDEFHGGNEHDENGLIDTSSQQKILACDSCDRNFPSETSFNKHMSEHRVCGLDGCTFSAHVKIIEKHIEMQHSTGIFERMRNLDSPENIAKWIEERKARFPSKENIEKRHKHQEELWKKGIRIGEKKPKLGRDKTRMVRKDPQTRQKERDDFFKKRQEKRDKVIKKFQPKLLLDEKSDWNGNLPPFRGIVDLFEDKEEEKCMISDDEDDYIKRTTKIEDLVKVNSSLGALMAYGSDYSEDDDELPTNNVQNEKGSIEKQMSKKEVEDTSDKKDSIPEAVVDSDDEGPLEVKTAKTSTFEEISPTEMKKHEESSKKTRKRKSNNRGKDQKLMKKANTQHFAGQFHTRKISHLEKILDEDIRRERNIILQCVRHTVENNFYMNIQ